jgi:subtilisin family serine protease
MTRDALKQTSPKVRIHPDDDPSKTQYLYNGDVVLVRSPIPNDVRDALNQIPEAQGWQAAADEPVAGVATITLAAGADIDSICRQIDARAGRLGAAMPEHVVHITVQPAGTCPATEPIPAQQGPVPDVNSDPATSGQGVKVVVIDTGRRPAVEQQHSWLRQPAISGNVENAQVGHYRGHGTFVTGVVRCRAPKATVDVNDILFWHGAVVEGDFAKNLEEALTKDKAQVISMSAGTTSRDGLPPLALQVVCERINASGTTVLVAAAGNDGDDSPFYPAYFSETMPNIVSVGAVDENDQLAPYSNRIWPSVYARGSKVVNGYPQGQYTYQEPPLTGQTVNFPQWLASWDGTSFAAPTVAGLVAARMSKTSQAAPAALTDIVAGAQQRAIGGGLPIVH